MSLNRDATFRNLSWTFPHPESNTLAMPSQIRPRSPPMALTSPPMRPPPGMSPMTLPSPRANCASPFPNVSAENASNMLVMANVAV
jgi:hypothetical protein